MFNGTRMMLTDWMKAGIGLLAILGLRKSKALPAMFAFLLLGLVYGLVKDASLPAKLRRYQ